MNATSHTSILAIGQNIKESENHPLGSKSSTEAAMIQQKIDTTELVQQASVSEVLQQVQSGKSQLSMRDVELKFVTDTATHTMMVFVIDRASGNVLRSIPPEEMEKLSVGDLLEIAA